jgi:hypothetical protein
MKLERQIADLPTWPSISLLEDELQEAICQATTDGGTDSTLAEIDKYFARDDDEDLTAYRLSLLWLLAALRPHLADLLGGPSTT